jgi:hypothetical protein
MDCNSTTRLKMAMVVWTKMANGSSASGGAKTVTSASVMTPLSPVCTPTCSGKPTAGGSRIATAQTAHFLEYADTDMRVKGTIPIDTGVLFRIGHTWMRIESDE